MSSFKAAVPAFFSFLFIFVISPIHAVAQQQPQGFAVERLYPSPAGSGWFVMDDLNMGGRWGGAVAVTSGYASEPVRVRSADGTRTVPLVSDEAFIDIGLAGTYRHYRVSLNFPMPLVVSGSTGMPGPQGLAPPSFGLGSHPDTISDPRVGFDMRLTGAPDQSLRLGIGAQLIMPSGDRADYVTDGTYRGMFRFLAAGDAARFSYAGQVGLHVRSLDESAVPNGPHGNEFLFGIGAARRFSLHGGWEALAGPEVYGETAIHSFFDRPQTGLEGLLMGRLERMRSGPRFRLKAGFGHGLVQHFGAPEWRFLLGMELLGEQPGRNAH